jgi:hypothetical protein
MLLQYEMQAETLVGIPSDSHWYGCAVPFVGSVQQQQ